MLAGVAELWTPTTNLFGPRKFVARERIVTLPSGERVRVSIDDSTTVTQVEHDHTLDAIVRPQTVRVKVQRMEGRRRLVARRRRPAAPSPGAVRRLWLRVPESARSRCCWCPGQRDRPGSARAGHPGSMQGRGSDGRPIRCPGGGAPGCHTPGVASPPHCLTSPWW